jgi:hypothetical protein
VTAHAHGTPAVEQAMAAGVDGIEHCSRVTDRGFGLVSDVASAGGAPTRRANHALMQREPTCPRQTASTADGEASGSATSFVGAPDPIGGLLGAAESTAAHRVPVGGIAVRCSIAALYRSAKNGSFQPDSGPRTTGRRARPSSATARGSDAQ